MVFLYYMPGAQTGDIATIEKAGIKGIFDDDTPFGQVPVTGGPDKGNGMLVAMDIKDGPAIGYYPEKQKWQKVGAYWIGYDINNPPVPTALERPTMLLGHYVELGDKSQNQVSGGHSRNLPTGQWVVPVARHFFPAEGSPVPKFFAYDAEGKEVELPDPKYAEFCRGAEVRWFWFCKENGESIEESNPDESKFYLNLIDGHDEPEHPDFAARFDFVAKALSINYRVTARELRVLGLIDTLTLKQIEEAVFDWPVVVALSEAALKKNGASTPDGSDSEDTGGES